MTNRESSARGSVNCGFWTSIRPIFCQVLDLQNGDRRNSPRPVPLDPRKRGQPIGPRNDPEHEMVSRMAFKAQVRSVEAAIPLSRAVSLPSPLVRLIEVGHTDQPPVIGNLGGRFPSLVQLEEKPSPFSLDEDDFSFRDLVEKPEPVLPRLGGCYALHVYSVHCPGAGAIARRPATPDAGDRAPAIGGCVGPSSLPPPVRSRQSPEAQAAFGNLSAP